MITGAGQLHRTGGGDRLRPARGPGRPGRYLDEHDDAAESRRWVEEAGRKCVRVAGTSPSRRTALDRRHGRAGVRACGRALVNNAAFQATRDSIEKIPDEEWDRTLATNPSVLTHLTKAAVPPMPPRNGLHRHHVRELRQAPPKLLSYDVTEAGIANMAGALARLLAAKGIRANSVAPGPIWAPLIPATMPPEQWSVSVRRFHWGAQGSRPSRPLTTVMLASDEASYVSGAGIAVTGGVPIV